MPEPITVPTTIRITSGSRSTRASSRVGAVVSGDGDVAALPVKVVLKRGEIGGIAHSLDGGHNSASRAYWMQSSMQVGIPAAGALPSS